MKEKNISKSSKGVLAKAKMLFGKQGARGTKVAIFATTTVVITAVIAGVALSSISNPAYALSFGHHGGFKDQSTTADATAEAKKRFARMDDNSDGIITADEIGHGKKGKGDRHANKFARMLSLIDGNGDEAVSEQEFVDYAVARFNAIDTDGNGEISDEEGDNAKDVIRAEWQKERFKLLDTDSNGQISAEEYAAGDKYGKRGRKGHRGHRGSYDDDEDDD